MPKRKKVGATTPLRYTYKAIRDHGGEPSPELLQMLGQTQQSEWSKGFGQYKELYELIKPVLRENGVPSALWGLYRSYAFELENKVRVRGILTLDELITIWERKAGLDRNVMLAIAEAIGVEAEKESQPKP